MVLLGESMLTKELVEFLLFRALDKVYAAQKPAGGIFVQAPSGLGTLFLLRKYLVERVKVDKIAAVTCASRIHYVFREENTSLMPLAAFTPAMLRSGIPQVAVEAEGFLWDMVGVTGPKTLAAVDKLLEQRAAHHPASNLPLCYSSFPTLEQYELAKKHRFSFVTLEFQSRLHASVDSQPIEA
jgi:hypothetical protein